MNRHQSFAAAVLIVTLGINPIDGGAAPTQSQVTSDGGSVKSGDVIIWQVNKPIALQVAAPVAAPGSPATPAAVAVPPSDATVTVADAAAAATAVKTAAHKLLDAAGPAP